MNPFPHIELEPLGPLWLEFLVIGMTLVVWGYSFYSTRFQPVKLRAMVTVLRGLLLAFSLFLLHHPTLTRQTVLPKEQRMAVLIDRSGSMGAQSENQQIRYERAFAAVQRPKGENQYEVFEFDQNLTESLGAAIQPRVLSGNKTDFYTSLSQLFAQNSDFNAVLFLSDGHDLGKFSQMSAEETGRWLQRLGAPPINTVLVGSHQKGPEIAIHSIDAPAFSYVRAPVRIRATVIVRNLDNHQTQVQLLDADKVIQIKDLVLDEQGFGSVEFEHYPEQQGEHLFTISVPSHHLEKNIENNRQQVLIDIGRDKINVLHIAGSITWDLQGLRAMFERDPQVDLTAFYIMRTRQHIQLGVDNRMIPHDEMALVPFPTEEIFDRQLFGFDVVVFHDFDAGTYFSDSYQARRLMKKIREFVQDHHGGFVVIGGPRTAGGPSLGLTPLADMLPLIPPIHRVPYDKRSHEPVFTPVGRHHPLLRNFDPKHQPFDGMMKALTKNKNANILLENAAGYPLLASGNQGTGRVLFLNTSSSWKWRRDALADGKTGESYYDFWEQSLKWVIQDPSLHHVRLTATKTVNHPLTVEVDLLIRDKQYKPAASVSGTLLMKPLDGRSEGIKKTFSTDGEGTGRVQVTVNRPGYYRLELLEEPWKSLAKPKTLFLGGSQDELRNQDLVPETLQRLAAVSAGKFFPSVEAFDSNDIVWGESQRQTIVETQRLKLRNWLWSLPLLILIAGMEWVLRRSSHLA